MVALLEDVQYLCTSSYMSTIVHTQLSKMVVISIFGFPEISAFCRGTYLVFFTPLDLIRSCELFVVAYVYTLGTHPEEVQESLHIRMLVISHPLIELTQFSESL